MLHAPPAVNTARSREPDPCVFAMSSTGGPVVVGTVVAVVVDVVVATVDVVVEDDTPAGATPAPGAAEGVDGVEAFGMVTSGAADAVDDDDFLPL